MSHMPFSRRTFLTQLSSAAALGILHPLPLHGSLTLAPAELIPESDESQLRELALIAVDAARTAGATFADVRMGAGQVLIVNSGFGFISGPQPATEAPWLVLAGGYGIRVVVDGAWGFAADEPLNADRVKQTAQLAVVRARANRPRRPRTLELAPTPRVLDGRWASPMEQDPFLVPVGVQAEYQRSALGAVANMPKVPAAAVSFTWHRSSRVFASSEGTLVSQRVVYALPGATVHGRESDQHSVEPASVEYTERGQYGYEVIARVDLAEKLREASQRAIEASRRPRLTPIPAEVGRHDLVFNTGAMAGLLTDTLAEALNAERVLGYQANRAGTSFATPPIDMLGTYCVGSPLVTVRADRTQPHAGATVAWDDEGTPAEAFPIIERGVITDYLTARQSAGALAEVYQKRGMPLRSHGCASGGGSESPTVRLPNLTLEPGKASASVEDLIADTKRGYYIEEIGGRSDQQLLNSQFGGRARLIRNGQLGEPISDLAFQFITPHFWASLDALGGPASARTGVYGTGLRPFDPLQMPYASVSAVPARARQVNVLNTGRTA